MQIDFCSYSVGDEDYCGYDYSLVGKLSEVRIVYLNRFVQEVCYLKLIYVLLFVNDLRVLSSFLYVCSLLVISWVLSLKVLMVS